jgi:GT2 family glycosyltransferase
MAHRAHGAPAGLTGRLLHQSLRQDPSVTSSRTTGQPPADGTDVAIVVISRNRRADVLATLPRHEAPVVLVDNGSTDGTVEAVREAHPQVSVLAVGRNEGARARTLGAAHAGTPFVAFADDDSWWAPGDLARAVKIMQAHPRLALLNARILVGPQERLDTVCDVMAASPLGTAPDLPGPSLLGFVACATLVRTAAFQAVGGFDTIIRFPGEEERLALDLATTGWGLAYVDEITVHHHPSPRRDSPHRRQAGIWRSRLLTAVMRLPAAHVARVTVEAARSGRSGREGLLRAVPDAPAALRHRRPIPPRVRADLRRLAGDAG